MNFESDSLAARRRKVVFYGRVSTEMEAQIAALKNQIIWYQQLAERHPEWTVVTMYEDAAVIIGLKTLRLKKSQKHAAF